MTGEDAYPPPAFKERRLEDQVPHLDAPLRGSRARYDVGRETTCWRRPLPGS